jgi:hypothetical protein
VQHFIHQLAERGAGIVMHEAFEKLLLEIRLKIQPGSG